MSNPKESEKKSVETTMKIPGMRGPRNFQEIEKPKEGKKTIRRLLGYFKAERILIEVLLAVVIIVVCSSVYAPSLQSKAIDMIAAGSYEKLPSALGFMLVVYGVYCGEGRKEDDTKTAWIF